MTVKIIIFGITGDLGKRKLLPALSCLYKTNQLSDCQIIGVSRRLGKTDTASFLNETGFKDLTVILELYKMDLSSSDDYYQLKKYLDIKLSDQVLIYLSVPPEVTSEIINNLGKSQLNCPNVKLMVEKPFGTNYLSAKTMFDNISSCFSDENLFLIDHYLAKDMVSDLITLRQKNDFIKSIWNNNYIESINIVASELLDVEGRSLFYEQTGALRDMIQGHLMQLLMLTICQVNKNFKWDDLLGAKVDCLSKIKPNLDKTLRKQYFGYRQEVNNPTSVVETFVKLSLQSEDSNWKNVPINLIAGKALKSKKTAVYINLKSKEQIIFNFDPEPNIELKIYEKEVDGNNNAKLVDSVYKYNEKATNPYKKVFLLAMANDKSLFATKKEILLSWQIIDQVENYWQTNLKTIDFYNKQSDINDLV